MLKGVGITDAKERKLQLYSCSHYRINKRVYNGANIVQLAHDCDTSVEHITKTYYHTNLRNSERKWQSCTRSKYECIWKCTVYKNQYVKAQSVKVKTPLTFSEEEVSFSTSNNELLHLFINQHPIFSNSDFNQCVDKLVEVIVKDKKRTQKHKCMFETWNALGISLEMGEWTACSKVERDDYKYI